MAVMYVLCAAFALLLLVLVVTQVILPIARGQKLFPLFRRTQMKLEGEIAELRSQENEQHLRQQRDQLAARVKPAAPPSPPTATSSGIRPNASTAFSSGRTASDDAGIMSALAMSSAFGNTSSAGAFGSSSVATEASSAASCTPDSSNASACAPAPAPASTD